MKLEINRGGEMTKNKNKYITHLKAFCHFIQLGGKKQQLLNQVWNNVPDAISLSLKGLDESRINQTFLLFEKKKKKMQTPSGE